LEPGRNLFGLSAQAKARLIEKLSSASPMRSGRPQRQSDLEVSDSARRLDVSEFAGHR